MASFEWHTAKLVQNLALSTMVYLRRDMNNIHRYLDLIGLKTQQPVFV